MQEEKTKRRQYLVAKKELYEGAELRMNRRSKMAVEFRRLQKEVISKSFEENVKDNKRKIKSLKEAKDREENNAENVKTVFGVKVGDQELEEHKEKTANVWGGAEVQRKQKKC